MEENKSNQPEQETYSEAYRVGRVLYPPPPVALAEFPNREIAVIPRRYCLRLDTLYVVSTRVWTWSCTLHAGEICEYFAHSDTYLFASREGVVPFYNRETVERHPEWFAPMS